MNWPTRILALLVLVIIASLVAVVSRKTLRTPRQVLEEVQLQLQSESYDEQDLLRQLSSSLRRAEGGDLSLPATRMLCADIRMTRGELFLNIGATREAREDFEIVLEKYRPGDRDVRRLLIHAESSAGEVLSALAHLEELLREQPNFGQALVEKGHLQQQLANRALEQCDEKLRFVLVEADAEKGAEILRTLASRDPSDPARATIILKLKELFPASADESLGQILGLCEEASQHLVSSRKAYVQSFSLGLDPVALTRYLEILKAAGRSAEALRLGSIVALEGPERADPTSALLLIEMLMERRNYEHAGYLASIWIDADQPVGAAFLRLSCEALFRAKKWSDLNRAAYKLRSIGTSEDEDIWAFYSGFAQANSARPRLDKAMRSLMDFANSRADDHIPGAREMAWREIARLRKERGELSREREAIQAALGQSPANAGSLWLRRAEIQLETPHNGYRLPLDSWATGMSLLPKRSDDLLAKFIEMGELTLQAEERNIDVIFADLKRSGQRVPSRDYGPYALYRIAQMHGEEGNFVGQLAAGRKLLDHLPDFIPALDLVIEARLALNDREKFIELVLERIELTGINESTEEMISAIRIDEYTMPQLLRVMQADPRNTGRMVVTKWFYENGENSSAIDTIETSSRSTRTDEERIFGSQVLMAEGDFKLALRWLDEIEPESPQTGTKLRLAMSCAMAMGKTDTILERLAALLNGQEPGPQELLILADGCIRVNQLGPAQVLLDQIPPGSIGDPGKIRRREVLLALLRGDEREASAIIERSAAFLDEEQYLVARLLLDAQRGDWVRARKNAEELRSTQLARLPLVDVLIDLIVGENQRALENTSFALQLNPLVPTWIVADGIARLAQDERLELPPSYGSKARSDLITFIEGRGEALMDPRETATLLIASEIQGSEPFILAILEGMEQSERGLLWREMLKAEIQSKAKNIQGAVLTYNGLLRSYSDCLPAWDALEAAQAQQYGSNSHPQVVSVRNRRLIALAQADPEGAAGLLIQGKRLKAKGELESALRVSLKAQQLAPDWFEPRIAVATLYADLGHWEPALEEWRKLVEGTNPGEVARSVAGYIRTLGRAARTTPPVIEMSQIKVELDALDARRPYDPRVVLALAHIDLMMDEKNPAFGLERAWSRLRALREHFDVPLEELQRGATQAWANYYVETDPDSAVDFILSELGRQPGNLYLWRLLGQVYRDLGRFSESIETLNRVALMAPSVEVQMELARSYAALGANPRTVSRVLKAAAGLKKGEESLESQLLLAEAQLSAYDPKSWATAIVILEEIWESRHQLEQQEARTHLAKLYARGLLLRGDPGDARRAVNVLSSELQNTSLPYEHEAFTCLIGLARSFDPVQQD